MTGLKLRMIFAFFVFTVFLASLSGNWTFAMILMPVLALGGIVAVAVLREPAAHGLNRFVIRPVMATNNRLLGILFVLWIFSMPLACTTERGAPLLLEPPQTSSEISDTRSLRQKYLDLYKGHVPKTELTETDESKPQSYQDLSGWTNFWTRFSASSILFLCFMIYTPIAFTDEAKRAFVRVWNVWAEKSEGTAGPPLIAFWLRQLLKIPQKELVAAVASKGGAVVGTAGMGMGLKFVSELLREIFSEIIADRITTRGRR